MAVTNNRAVFYLGLTNGTMQMATNNYTHVFQAFDAVQDVGRDPSGARYFNGLIDEVCIWNRTLSAAEIGQILTNGINGSSFGGARTIPNPATFTWTGNADVYWTNALNWATNATPTSGSTVYFNDAANANTATQLGAAFSIGALNLSGGLRCVGITDTNKLTLGSGGIVATNAAAGVSLSVPIVLGAAQTWAAGPATTLTLSGALTGTGNPALTLAGGGTFNLNNASGYSGTVFVNGGTLSLPYGWTSPSLVGNISVASGATLIFNTHPYSYSHNNWTTNYGNLVVIGDNQCANLVLGGGQVNGTGYLRSGDIWGDTGGGNYNSLVSTQTALINVARISLYINTTFNVAHGAGSPAIDLQVNSAIASTSTGSNITKLGTGTLLITQPCTYAGKTTIGAGTLQIDGGDNLLPVATALTISNAATFTLNDNNQSVAQLLGSGTVNLGQGSLADFTTTTDTFGGVLTGTPSGQPATDTQLAPSGGFALAGTGKLIFTNRQTYAGDSWVSAGTLALTGVGTLPNSHNLVVFSGATLDASGRTDGALNVAPGQTLMGYGTVLGKVSITNGATVAPGQTVPGTLTTGAETWYGGGTYAWQISDPINAGGRDFLSITGALNLQSAVTNPFVLKITSLTANYNSGPLAGFSSRSNYQWTIATAAGGLLNFNPAAFTIDTSGFSNALSGGSFSLAQAGNSLVLSFTPAPPILGGAPILDANGYRFQFSGQPGQAFTVLYSTNLTTPLPLWVTNATGVFDQTGITNYTNPTPSDPAGYYRVRSP